MDVIQSRSRVIKFPFINFYNLTTLIKNGQLEKNDQIMPFLAAEMFKKSPGLTGLYISAAYSATLSTLSTGLNSFATVFFKSVYRKVS